MEKTDKRLCFCITLLAFNVLFIWGNSLLPGSVSGAISHWVRNMLSFILPGRPVNPDSGHGLVRKLAHFTEFAVLGGLLLWQYTMRRKKSLPAFFWGVLAACVDETIQRFVPDRGPSILDVLLDSLGVAVGIFLVMFGYTIRKKNQENFGG